MPVLARIAERFASEKPLDGIRLAACLHVTAETAYLMRALAAGGAEVGLCAANPLSTQDDVAAALAEEMEVHAIAGEDSTPTRSTWASWRRASRRSRSTTAPTSSPCCMPAVSTDDLIGGTEETTAGLLRLRHLEDEGGLRCPVLAVNESRTERMFNDRYGTGQSALDGIVRATNLLLAGHTLVLFGYGYTGKGIAERARGAGAAVIVCEVDPMRALEARMEGYEVMPALEAAARGDLFVTVTGSRGVLRAEHFERMKDGAVLANAGHFDIEIDLDDLRAAANGRARGAAAGRGVRPGRPPPEPAGGRARGEPRGRPGPPAGGDGHELRQPGAGGRAPREARAPSSSRASCRCRGRSTTRSPASSSSPWAWRSTAQTPEQAEYLEGWRSA